MFIGESRVLSFISFFYKIVYRFLSKFIHCFSVMKMETIRMIPKKLTDVVGKLGRNVARYPIWFFVMSLVSAALFITGLQRITYLTDLEELYVPYGARGLDERNIVESYFGKNYQNYVLGHETEVKSILSVIVVTKNTNQNSLRHHNGLLNHGKMIDTALNNLVVTTTQGENITLQDVCGKTRFSKGEKCQQNAITDVTNIKYLKYPVYISPITKEKIAIPVVLGNVSLNGSSVEDASALRLMYNLDYKNKNAKVWQKTATSFIYQSNWEDENYEVFTVTSESLEEELLENVHESLYVLPYAAGLLVCFMTMNGFVFTGRKWNSKWNLIGLQNVLVQK